MKMWFSKSLPVLRWLRQQVSRLLVVIATPLALLCRVFGLRVPVFYVARIGHLIVEPECYVKEHLLNTGRIPPALLLAPRGQVANSAALRYWSRYFTVIENPLLVRAARPLERHPLTRFNVSRYAVAMYRSADCYPIQTAWGDRPPLWDLTAEDAAHGRQVLQRMGVPPDTWYVCIHAREGGYSSWDEHCHSYRNMAIDDFRLAIDYIIAQGGICIRMGDPTMRPAPAVPGLIDYALSPLKSDRMDLFLSATCRFFLGSNSGAALMATAFGTPSLMVNMAPLTAAPYGVRDLALPMLYRQRATGRVMHFREILDSPCASFRLTEEFENAGIQLLPVAPADIREAAAEQWQRVTGTWVSDPDDEARQARFRGMLRPGHYCYGGSARIGSAFLKNCASLLD